MMYYIQLFSPHGLIRYHDPEVGKDKDTGGQVKYVLELLHQLSLHPQVRKVDLFTRRITDKKVSPAYSQPIEIVNDKARIVRISCGGNAYKAKEQLWPHLDEFTDNTIRFIEKENDFPDVVHGHYADGNYIAAELNKMFGSVFFATGHSLGHNKRKMLLGQGLDPDKINDQYKLPKRIAVEERVLQQADRIIVSTQYEITAQYQAYQHFAQAQFEVIPPGINKDTFYPFYRMDMPSFSMTTEQERALYHINSETERFLFQPDKPLILSIGRADKRKNFETIISSYGQDKELQAMANLAIFAGVRHDISQMPEDEQETLTNLLLLMDKYDLYGKMAIPKKNDPTNEVPEIYRLAARRKGVFVNATPGENFGLTIIEAAACGLPVVASPTGGPKEIIETAGNGILVDMDDTGALAIALKKIIADNQLWEQYSEQGIINSTATYSWEAHTDKYMHLVQELTENIRKRRTADVPEARIGKRLLDASVFFISDLDGTLVERENEQGLQELTDWVNRHRKQLVFGISSGRNRQLTQEALSLYPLPAADIIICSVGTEIYYSGQWIPDSGWAQHISYQWKREELQRILAGHPLLRLQEEEAQTAFKLSYYVDERFTEDELADLYSLMGKRKLRARVYLTANRYLDIVPLRAGKGNAVRYLSYKWNIPIHRFITSGNGGNDIDMLKGRSMGIVVSNHDPDLEVLKGKPDVYFSRFPLSEGILDGIHHYRRKDARLQQVLGA